MKADVLEYIYIGDCESCLKISDVFEDFEEKDDTVNILITAVFVEQPWLHWVC